MIKAKFVETEEESQNICDTINELSNHYSDNNKTFKDQLILLGLPEH